MINSQISRIIILTLLSFAIISCTEQEGLKNLDTESLSVIGDPVAEVQPDNTLAEPVEPQDPEEHNDDNSPEPPTSLAVDASASSMNISSELSKVTIIQLSVSTTEYFVPGMVNLAVDMGEVQALADDYITATLSESSVDLSNATQATVNLTINVEEMAPSFDAKQIKIKLSSDQGSAGMLEKEVAVNLSVIPQITIGILSDSVPHTYTHGQVWLRPHGGEGVQVVFQNQTMNFGAGGGGPCIHTTSPLVHCNTGSGRMEPGDTYLPPKVAASRGVSRAIYYNHFVGSDNIQRYVNFNTVPGTESN